VRRERPNAHRRAWAREWAALAAHRAGVAFSERERSAHARDLDAGDRRVRAILRRAIRGPFHDVAAFAKLLDDRMRSEDPVAISPR